MERRGNVNVCGIYAIKTMQGKIKYVGGAVECNDAYSRHEHFLSTGEYAYTNKHPLQVLFNTENLIFTVLKTCKEEELDALETKYIKMFEDTIVNSDKKGKRRKSKPTSEETERRRNANLGEKNPHNTKLSAKDVKEIKKMLKDGIKQSTLADKFGISRTLIYNIKNGIRWASVEI